MLDSFFFDVTRDEPRLQKSEDGVAFLKAMLSLYDLSHVSYIAINVPKADQFLHCVYSDHAIRQKITAKPFAIEKLKLAGLLEMGAVDWSANERLSIELKLRTQDGHGSGATRRAFSYCLSTLRGETAVFATSRADEAEDGAQKAGIPLVEMHVLAKYFHGHILRLNGHDTFASLLMSARELDCLKWTAAGKTAWEASKILGISERTVIFHLNAARKKLDCATTTQAVAKAVATQLISI